MFEKPMILKIILPAMLALSLFCCGGGTNTVSYSVSSSSQGSSSNSSVNNLMLIGNYVAHDTLQFSDSFHYDSVTASGHYWRRNPDGCPWFGYSFRDMEFRSDSLIMYTDTVFLEDSTIAPTNGCEYGMSYVLTDTVSFLIESGLRPQSGISFHWVNIQESFDSPVVTQFVQDDGTIDTVPQVHHFFKVQ